MATLSGKHYKNIYGTSRSDRLLGSDKTNDSIHGYSGNDLLMGFAGDDRLFGGSGKDTLSGGSDDDRLDGGSDDDYLAGGSGDDTLEGGEGRDTLSGGSGRDTASYESSSAGVAIDLNDGSTAGGDSAGDVLISIENLIGSTRDDVFIGSKIANHLDGRGGDDTMLGMDGDDTLLGGAGEDTLNGGDDDDFLDGGSDDDVLAGTSGDDTLVGGEGDDILMGGDDNDLLIGGEGADTIAGGDGIDTVSYDNLALPQATYSQIGVWVDLEAGTGSVHAAGDLYIGVENVIGSDYADSITGDDNANLIEGGDGGDDLRDNGGDDTVRGGDGDDFFIAGDGADTYDGGDGIDTLSYALSQAGVTIDLETETASGGFADGDTFTGFENVFGTLYDDTLRGDDGDNEIVGGAGEDVLIDSLGDDILVGNWDLIEDGDRDTFVFADTRGPELDYVVGFEQGIDVIDLSDTDFSGFNDLTNGGNRYMEQVGDDTVLHHYDHDIVLYGVEMSTLDNDDFIF